MAAAGTPEFNQVAGSTGRHGARIETAAESGPAKYDQLPLESNSPAHEARRGIPQFVPTPYRAVHSRWGGDSDG